jgi:hypothetical protein
MGDNEDYNIYLLDSDLQVVEHMVEELFNQNRVVPLWMARELKDIRRRVDNLTNRMYGKEESYEQENC